MICYANRDIFRCAECDMICIPFHVPQAHIALFAYRIPQGYIAHSGRNAYRCRACGTAQSRPKISRVYTFSCTSSKAASYLLATITAERALKRARSFTTFEPKKVEPSGSEGS